MFSFMIGVTYPKLSHNSLQEGGDGASGCLKYVIAYLPLHVANYLPSHRPDTVPTSPEIPRGPTVSANSHL